MKKIAKKLFTKKAEENFICAENAEVTVLFSSENPALLGKKMQTTAIELSPKSIRLEVEYPIEINSVLDIAVKLDNNDRSYNLTGNVRWRLPAQNGKYQIVLVLRERMDIRSDFKAWKTNFNQNFEFAKVG